MSTPTAKNLLQRLHDLKIWQESHDSLLRAENTCPNNNYSNQNNTSASDYRTIVGLSQFDSPSSSFLTSIDQDTPIKPTSKSFEQLVEEKLSLGDEHGLNTTNVAKKPFLRKGTGLKRFRTESKSVRTRPSKTFSLLTTPQGVIASKAEWCPPITEDTKEPKTNGASDQRLYERALEKELLIFEALEEKTHESSFCSTSSSVLDIFNSSPKKVVREEVEEKHVHWESDEEVIETQLEQEDLVKIFTHLKSLVANNKVESSDDEESSLDSCSVVSVGSESEKKSVPEVNTTDVQKTGYCTSCGDLLHKKIADYDLKIKNVIEERDKIRKIRAQLENKEQNFQKKHEDFENKERNFLRELEIERKKFSREKNEFQEYVKETQSRPTRKDREEMSNLKKEVAELRESLKLRETKNGMCQARLRNQIKMLEKENVNLKGQLEKFTQENAKLSAMQKLNTKKSSRQGQKVLNESNKNVINMNKRLTRGSRDDSSLLDLFNLTKSFDAQNVSDVIGNSG